jgi:hypothetical protein
MVVSCGNGYEQSEVLTAVNIKIVVFWNVMPYTKVQSIPS